MTDMTDPATSAVTRIILVRHGESVANAGGKTPDHIRIFIKVGCAQSSDFAQRLDCVPTLLVTSSFPSRAADRGAGAAAVPRRSHSESGPSMNSTFWSLRATTTRLRRTANPTSSTTGGGSILNSSMAREAVFSLFLDRAREAVHRLESQNPGGCVVIFTMSTLCRPSY